MITREEYELLKQYRAKGYGWIARDKNCGLYAFKVMPVKSYPFWRVENVFHLPCLIGECGDNILTCVTWEDEEPTKINDLIRDYESHQIIKGESDKVVIPQFIADWIEENKGIYTIRGLFSNSDMPSNVEDWLYCNNHNCNLMARAWLNGYEIEKEKLYHIKISENQYTQRFDESKIDSSLINDKLLARQFTEEQIKKINPNLMALAVEVEE